MIYTRITVTLRCDHDGCKGTLAVRGREGEFDHSVKQRTKDHARKLGWFHHVNTNRWFCAECSRQLTQT